MRSEGEDPASPRFDADEPRVEATPFGTLDDEHPLRRSLGNVEYPASSGRVLAGVRADPTLDEEQLRWFAAVLPADRTFDSVEDVVASLGTWGPPPPSTRPSL